MFVILFLCMLVLPTHAKYLRVEEDMKLSEKLYEQLFNGRQGRLLGTVDDLELDLWRQNYTNGKFIVPVTLLENDIEEGVNSITESDANYVFETLQQMENKLGNVIEFTRYDNIEPKPDKYIKIGNFGGGCWSYVGRIPDQYQPQPLNIGSTCLFTDVIEHEMMHALGFFHEQARPDRDDYVTIHWDNIDPSKYVNFEKAIEVNSRGSPYDYESIMHYSSTAFAVDPELPTISTDSEFTLGSALSMTDIDMEQIRLLYRCNDSVRNIDNNCIDSCPCRLNEGNCTISTQCEGALSCINSRCIDNNETLAPTTSPTTGAPTTSSSPTDSPTTSVPITRAPTSGEDSDNVIIYATVASIVFVFTVILIYNVI